LIVEDELGAYEESAVSDISGSSEKLPDCKRKFQKDCIELDEFFVVSAVFDFGPTQKKEIE